jgi:hypothetical protein
MTGGLFAESAIFTVHIDHFAIIYRDRSDALSMETG